MIGFKLDELMTGTHQFTDGRTDAGVKRPLFFHITWGNSSLARFFNPFSGQFLLNEARGVITVDGLVNKADCTGTLRLLYFTERKIRYDLIFKDDAGKAYRYVGEKRDIWPWNLHRTHVTCYGTITDLETGQTISESVIYFPYRETLAFLLSFRLRFNGVFTP
ncbi:MAG: hypothetical protein AB1724_07680 [Thermodesulfobacteriota bacterium]